MPTNEEKASEPAVPNSPANDILRTSRKLKN
jgi:hypothetical protein